MNTLISQAFVIARRDFVAIVGTPLAMLALMSCSDAATKNSSNNGGEEVAKFEPYTPFPEAKSVRLFHQKEVFDDAKVGRLSDTRGRILTASEQTLLSTAFVKKTIIRVPAEGYMFTACAFSPRHLFRFYDAHNKKLGEALICFDCYDAELRPPGSLVMEPEPQAGQSILAVDYAVLEGLMKRMKVPTYAPE